jgi:predicted HTH transcriptional regulator
MELTLTQLIKLGENQQQDFKHTIEDQKKIARTLVAFANTEGGRLLIGVKDNGKVAGVNPEEEYHMIEGAAKLFCKPEIKFETKIWQDGFRLVLEVSIEANPLRHHKAQNEEGEWKIYIRRKDQTLLANKIVLKVWNLERKGVQKPLKYGKDEQVFLTVFSTDATFTLSKLYRMFDFPKQKIDDLVALFIHWKLIQMDFTTEGVLYKLI